MAYVLPTRHDPPTDPRERADELVELRHDRRPLLAIAVAVAALLALALAGAEFGMPAVPVGARSTSAATGEPVPAVAPVDVGPRAVRAPAVVAGPGRPTARRPGARARPPGVRCRVRGRNAPGSDRLRGYVRFARIGNP